MIQSEDAVIDAVNITHCISIDLLQLEILLRVSVSLGFDLLRSPSFPRCDFEFFQIVSMSKVIRWQMWLLSFRIYNIWFHSEPSCSRPSSSQIFKIESFLRHNFVQDIWIDLVHGVICHVDAKIRLHSVATGPWSYSVEPWEGKLLRSISAGLQDPLVMRASRSVTIRCWLVSTPILLDFIKGKSFRLASHTWWPSVDILRVVRRPIDSDILLGNTLALLCLFTLLRGHLIFGIILLVISIGARLPLSML